MWVREGGRVGWVQWRGAVTWGVHGRKGCSCHLTCLPRSAGDDAQRLPEKRQEGRTQAAGARKEGEWGARCSDKGGTWT